jgi:arylsulfatase A-like enzyme
VTASATTTQSAGPDAAAPVAAAPKPERPYNVIFILIDSLRADMPWTGYERDIAPWLTAFAKKSVLYPRAYAASSYTAKSVAPVLVGQYPSEMYRDSMFFTTWGPKNLFIGERLQQAGHRTLAGHVHGYFLPRFGNQQGFDDYQLLPGTVLQNKVGTEITGHKLTAMAKQMLSDPKNVKLDKGKRFFAYFHYLDPHHEYARHKDQPSFGNDRRARYDGEVLFSDKQVGELVDWALGQPWGKETAVIISADHGEGFGERNHFRHSYELWEALVRVPLFIYVPGAPSSRIELPRGAIDVAPTIADLMGIPADPPFRGQSLVPEVFGAKAEPRPVVTEMPRSGLMDRRRAVIDGDWKIIAFSDDKKFMLFNVKDDFKEEKDLAKSEPEQLARMKALYAKVSADIPPTKVEDGGSLMGAPPGQRW